MRSGACASLIWDASIIGGVKKTHFIKAVFLKGNDHIPHVFMRSGACASLIWDASIIGGVKETHFIKAVLPRAVKHISHVLSAFIAHTAPPLKQTYAIFLKGIKKNIDGA